MFLDTTFCVDLIREQRRGVNGPATVRLRGLGETPLQLSVFVLCELQAGARLSREPRRELRRVERSCDLADVVLPERGFEVAYGEAEAWLRRHGTPIGEMDLLIGVTAKVAGTPLLTRNAEHFQRIPGLAVEPY